MFSCLSFIYCVSLVSEKQGLTGLLQSPVRGAERAGLPGMLSGTRLNFASYTRFHVSLTTILLLPSLLAISYIQFLGCIQPIM